MALLGSLALLATALLTPEAHAATGLPQVCPTPSEAGKPVNMGCGGRAQTGQLYRTPRDTDLVRVMTDGGTSANWESTAYQWKRWSSVAVGEYYDTCRSDVAEGVLVTANTCTAWGMVPRQAVVDKPVGSTALLKWTNPTQNTDDTPLTDLAGVKIYRGATAEGLLVVDTLAPTVTSWTSPALTVGQHQFAITAVNAKQVESERLLLPLVNVAGLPKPTVTLSVSPADGVERVTPALTWSTTNATACTAAGGWTGAKAVAGSETGAAITATTTYRISCTGPGGTAETSAQVAVSARPKAPTGGTVTLQ